MRRQQLSAMSVGRRVRRSSSVLLAIVLLVLLSCTSKPRVGGECRLPVAAGELGSLCGFHNPEDLVYFRSANALITAEFAVGGAIVAFSPSDLSSNPRTLRLWPRDSASSGMLGAPLGDANCRPPSPASLHPHGLGSLEVEGGSSQLAVVSHGAPDAIHLFDVLGVWPAVSLAWRGCVQFPPRATGNDVALHPDGSIYATNWAPSRAGLSGIYYLLKGSFGGTTGEALRWDSSQGWRSVPSTAGALPNGIALSADDQVLYVADGGRQRILAVDVSSEAGPAHEPLGVLGNPDNLSLTPDGKLLTVSFNREGDLSILCLGQDRVCRVGWRVVVLDPRTRAMQVLFEHDGSVLSMATGAVLVGEHLFVGSMADDRIGIWRISGDVSSDIWPPE